VSEPLREFVAEMPYERQSILEFVMRAAGDVPVGARVADVGSGDAPFRELFSHTEYVTVDWEHSPHEGAATVDLVAAADAIPVDDDTFDACLLTQVLEHVAEPAAVLDEMARILHAGGRLYLTAPLIWELHEQPHDYYRYTSEGLRHLLDAAGFSNVTVEPRNDCFTTLAQLMQNVSHAMGRTPDGHDEQREEAARLLGDLAKQVAELGPLDVERVLPLGYAATGVKT
jgi:SAM-dependent methyltransferase